MKRTFTEFSQLSKSMFRPAPAPEPPPEPTADEMAEARAAEEVLAYFARGKGMTGAQPTARKEAATTESDARLAKLSETLEAARAEIARLKESLEKHERAAAEHAAAAATAERECTRLTCECARLRSELQKATTPPPEPETEKPCVADAPAPEHTPLLVVPPAIDEVFEGELREILLAVLGEAQAAAMQCARERRAALLAALLAVNVPNGELARRREALKQIMKDSGGYTDPRKLADLGFKLVSGRNHWKVEYAGIRMPLSKTPSDYRANLNAATDMANRCF